MSRIEGVTQSHGGRRALVGGLLLVALGVGLWVARWPTSLPLVWQLRDLDAAVISVTTACLEAPGEGQACHRLQARLLRRANDLRPANVKPLQPVPPVATPMPAKLDAWPMWHLAHWPKQWSTLMRQCYDIGEIEDRAPPSVEARYQACTALAQLAGRQGMSGH